MRSCRSILLLLTLACAVARPAPARTGDARPPLDYLRDADKQVHRFVLDNGMTCLVKEDHSAPVAAVEIWIGTGSIHEDEHLGAGLSHYMEHMAFKGTPTRGPADISREISDAGGDINAYTSLDRTVFHAVLPARNWKVGVDVLSDAVMNPRLPEDEWEREKNVILREMAMRRDNPETQINELLFQTAYRVHPYRYPIIGYDEIFRTMTREDLQAFVRRHYTPDNMITVVAGDVDPAEVEAALRETWSSFPRRARPPVVLPEEPPQLAARSARKTGAYNVSRLEWAYHTVALSHPDTPALDILAYITGHGRSSRLVREIKEGRRLVFDIGAGSYTPKYPGLFTISATFDPAREDEVVEAIEEEIGTWTTRPFPEEEIEKARRILLVEELGSLQTVKGQAASYASGEFYTGDPFYGEKYIARLQEVTADDLVAVARRYLRPENRTLALLTPAAAEPEQRAAPPEQSAPGVQRLELSNGVPLIVREDHRLPFVYFCMALRGGLLSEQEETSGISQLLSELLVRGTPTRTAEEVALQVEELGGSLSPFAGWNSFGLQARCLTPDTETFMALMADCLLRPTFPEEELEKQREVQRAAIRQERERPFFLATEALKQALFPHHPYRLNPNGRDDSVRSLTREQLESFRSRHVRADNLAVSVFGDIDTETARAMAERHLADLPVHPRADAPVPLPAPELPARVVQREPKEQAILLVGYPGVDVTDPRSDALDIVRETLSGLSSDLGIEVREKRGLVYYVGAFQRAGLEPGLFAIYAGAREDTTDEVERLAGEQVERIVAGGLREEELKRAQEQIIAAHQMGLQDNGGLAQICALNELYGLGYAHSFSTEERIRALGIGDVARAAASIFKPERQAVSLLLPASPQEREEDAP